MAEHYDEDGYFTAYQSGPVQERSAPFASDFADRVPEPHPFNGILNYIRTEEEKKVTKAWCGLPHADPRVPFGKVRWLVLGRDGKMYAYCAYRCAQIRRVSFLSDVLPKTEIAGKQITNTWIDEAKTGQAAVTITPTTVTMTREAFDSDNKVNTQEQNRLKRKVNRLRRNVAGLTEQLEELVRREKHGKLFRQF